MFATINTAVFGEYDAFMRNICILRDDYIRIFYQKGTANMHEKNQNNIMRRTYVFLELRVYLYQF